MKFISFFFILFSGVAQGFSQENADSLKVVDPQYKEDQFYLSVTYNLLGQKPNTLKQSGFSSGFHFGFIRDMPINEQRNVSVGAGLGLSANSYNQNMLISKLPDGAYSYAIIDEDVTSFNKNKFTTYLLELPLEFRWRTSTATDYTFWRIYTGLKVGYVFYNSSKFSGDLGNINYTNISDLNDFQYGLTFSAGYSTWNVHLYYGLNSIFKSSAKIDGTAIDMTSIKIGLMFYIL